MKLYELKPARGSKKRRKIVGRGNSSAHGTYSTRGLKGQKARTGVSYYPGFEGGRTSLVRQIPKNRGFRSFKPKWIIVNVGTIQDKFSAGAVVNKKSLAKMGIIKMEKSPVKLLGAGEITKKFTIIVDACSASAKDKVTKAGGKVKIGAEKSKVKK